MTNTEFPDDQKLRRCTTIDEVINWAAEALHGMDRETVVAGFWAEARVHGWDDRNLTLANAKWIAEVMYYG